MMADKEINFSSDWAHGDIVFVLDEGRVYANKAVLSMWSPVFSVMFSGDFKERDAAEIKLPGKKLEEFLEFMKVLHPPNKDIDGTNVSQVLPLGHEYQMTGITSRCEKYLLSQPSSLESLVMAESYGLDTLLQVCVNFAKTTPMKTLTSDAQYGNIEPTTLVGILTHKLEKVDTVMMDLRSISQNLKPNVTEICSGRPLYQGSHSSGSQKGCTYCDGYNLAKIGEVCSSYLCNPQ